MKIYDVDQHSVIENKMIMDSFFVKADQTLLSPRYCFFNLLCLFNFFLTPPARARLRCRSQREVLIEKYTFFNHAGCFFPKSIPETGVVFNNHSDTL